MKTKTLCPICRSNSTLSLPKINHVPIHCHILSMDRKNATEAAMRDIHLTFCKSCGHVFNSAFNPQDMNYNEDYENSLHASPRFREYENNLVTRLVDTYNLYEKNIIEIGCGKGHFLTALCRKSRSRGLGVDPTCSTEQIRKRDQNITFVKDYYSLEYRHYPADLICCRHVLEHIQYPGEFLTMIREALMDNPDTVVFFEVPNAEFILEGLSIWDFIYEHSSYFSPSSLHRVFTSAGFEVCNLTRAFGGQYLCIEARPCRSNSSDYSSPPVKPIDVVEEFVAKYYEKLTQWRRKMDKIAESRTRTVLWGAGSKGIMFLNMLPVGDEIEYVVDLNPEKHGKYIAGTGQKVMAPNFLKHYCPEVIIMMNPMYRREIRQMVADLGIKSTFWDV